jgi:hypothetical protein
MHANSIFKCPFHPYVFIGNKEKLLRKKQKKGFGHWQKDVALVTKKIWHFPLFYDCFFLFFPLFFYKKCKVKMDI